MRRLRKRQRRVDTLRSEARPKKRGRAGRIVYLSLIAALGAFVFDMFLGELLYLRGQGMVTRKVSVISLGYRGTVRDLAVREGDRVAADDVMMRVHSARMSKDIAGLSGDLAKVEGELSKLRTRRQHLKSLLPVARARMNKLDAFSEDMRELGKAGLTTSVLSANVLTDSFKALKDFKELQTEAQTVEQEIANTQETADRVRDALNQLRAIYNGGRVVAPKTGLVGRINVKSGSGVEPGTRVAEVFHGERFVLAYVPTGAIYDVEVGDKVALRYGFRLMEGEITRLLPLAHRLPQEFQRAFQTAARDQLVRIRIAETDQTPPLFTKTQVTWRTSARVWAIKGAEAAQRGVAAAIRGGRALVAEHTGWGSPATGEGSSP